MNESLHRFSGFKLFSCWYKAPLGSAIIQLKMPFKDLRRVLFHCYEENMISDEEFLLLYDEYSSKNPEFEPLVST